MVNVLLRILNFSHLDSSRHPRPAGAPPPSATTSSSSATSRGLTQRRPNSLRSPSSACKFRPPQTVLLPHSMRIKPQAFSPLQLPIPSISRDSVFRMHSMRAEGKLATPFGNKDHWLGSPICFYKLELYWSVYICSLWCK